MMLRRPLSFIAENGADTAGAAAGCSYGGENADWVWARGVRYYYVAFGRISSLGSSLTGLGSDAKAEC